MIKKQGLPKILLDNDENYLSFLNAVISHAEPHSDVLLDKHDNLLRVTITPSELSFRPSIITNLLAAHKLMGIKIIFSKSLAIQKNINYEIEF